MQIRRIKLLTTPGVQWIQIHHGSRFLDLRYDANNKVIDLALLSDNALTKLDVSVFLFRDADIIPDSMKMYLGRAVTPSGEYFVFLSSFTNIDWIIQE